MSLIDRLLGRPPAAPTAPAGTRRKAAGGSGAVARERLKLVLEYDRAQLTAVELERIRDDIIASISRHVDVARDDVHITLERGGRLVAEIPLSGRPPGQRPASAPAPAPDPGVRAR